MGNNVVYLMGAIMLLVGLIFVITALVNNKRVKDAESWPVVPGTVIRSEKKEFTSRSSGVTTHSYEPVVNYQYNLMGKTYEGKRLGFGSTRVNYNDVHKITDKYLSGTQVNVHYNPNKPEESVLEVASRSSKTFLVLGIIFMILGLLLLLLQLF